MRRNHRTCQHQLGFAELNNFTFQAIDLLPNDGNPGAYELLPDSGSTSAFVRVSGVDAEQKVAGLFSPLSLAAPSSAALSGSAAVNSTGLELHVNSQDG